MVAIASLLDGKYFPRMKFLKCKKIRSQREPNLVNAADNQAITTSILLNSGIAQIIL